MSSSAKDYSYHFGQAFANEVIEFGVSNFAGLPCSVVFATIVFMLDTTLRSATAKMYFVCGYLIELLLFYSIGTICFPPDTSTKGASSGYGGLSDMSTGFGQHMQDHGQMFGGGSSGSAALINRVSFLARPFQHFTTASFFNFSAGYLLGYWGNLNILVETKNAMVVNAYYAAFVLFCFLLSVFYLNTASWQSGLVSVVTGIIGGMACSSLIAKRVKLEAEYDGSIVTRDLDDASSNANHQSTSPGSSAARLPPGMTACDANNNDMVCRVFRASG
jgi:hypothetical protein